MNPAPLITESIAYVRRLEQGALVYGESRYRLARRVNWSHRYATEFVERESDLFKQDPDAYLRIPTSPEPVVEDVFARKVATSKVLEMVLKVAAHWAFAFLGFFLRLFERGGPILIYRKCYVDDVEAIFDPLEPGVLRAIFPFPLSAPRQLRYIRSLARAGHRFRLYGYPYSLGDMARFLVRRDIRSLERLERRAQIRLGRSVRRMAELKQIQLSDEFDVCSIDFVGAARRPGLLTTNRAHGSGKYYPFHGYDEFYILTQRQKQYYRAVRPCRYIGGGFDSHQGSGSRGDQQLPKNRVLFVFVSQTSSRAGAYLEQYEEEVLDGLSREFKDVDGIELTIKPHPNRTAELRAPGFRTLSNLSEIKETDDAIFVCFCSTSYLDKAFRGERYLLQYDILRPQICYDNEADVFTMDTLVAYLRGKVENLTNQGENLTNQGNVKPASS